MAFSALKDFCNRREPAARRILAVLVMLMAGLIVFLLSADKPWSAGIVKRMASAKGPKLEDYIVAGIWWGAVVALIAVILGLLLQRWWSLPSGAAFPESPATAGGTMKKWVIMSTLAAVVLAGWARQPRLAHGFWNDELMHLRYYAWGGHEVQTDGSLKFDKATWQDALFQNKKGNNHIWCSLEARAGHLLGGGDWTGTTPFSEASMRLLPFLSGLGTVILIALLGGAMGSVRAGFAAALIVAMHPWHVRWSVEIRGYSTMLLGITGALYCLLAALRTGRWRWWLGYAGCQTLYLLCFAGSIYVAGGINVVALIIIWTRALPGRDRTCALARLILAGCFSVVPLAIIMGPSVPQIAVYLNTSHSYETLDAAWFADLWSNLLSGLIHTPAADGSGGGLTLTELYDSSMYRKILLAGIIPLTLIGGLIVLGRGSWKMQLAGGSLLLAGALALIHNGLKQSAMMTWYMLYLVPLFALALGFAGHWLTRRFPHVPLLTSAPLIIAALYAAGTLPALDKMRAVPRHTIRQAVLAARGSAPALADDSTLTATMGTGAGQYESYDPRVRELKKVSQLEDMIKQADDENRRLVVYFADSWGLAHPRPGKGGDAEWPQLLALIESGDRFVKLRDFPAMEAMWSMVVYEYQPEVTVIKISPAKPTKPAPAPLPKAP